MEKLTTLTGTAGLTIAGISVASILSYTIVSIASICVIYALYRIGKSAYKEFSARVVESKSAMVVDKVA